MTHPRQLITVSFDQKLLHHPEAHHLRNMRIGLWLYLDLLSRMEGTCSVAVDPSAVASQMGLKEGTIRSWLGHLRKGGYVRVRRQGTLLVVTVRHTAAVEPAPDPAPEKPPRFFTAHRIEEALGEEGARDSIEAALSLAPDAAIQRALAGAMRIPDSQVRKSRTALFLYLLRRYTYENQEQDHPGD